MTYTEDALVEQPATNLFSVLGVKRWIIMSKNLVVKCISLDLI